MTKNQKKRFERDAAERQRQKEAHEKLLKEIESTRTFQKSYEAYKKHFSQNKSNKPMIQEEADTRDEYAENFYIQKMRGVKNIAKNTAAQQIDRPDKGYGEFTERIKQSFRYKRTKSGAYKKNKAGEKIRTGFTLTRLIYEDEKGYVEGENKKKRVHIDLTKIKKDDGTFYTEEDFSAKNIKKKGLKGLYNELIKAGLREREAGYIIDQGY